MGREMQEGQARGAGRIWGLVRGLDRGQMLRVRRACLSWRRGLSRKGRGRAPGDGPDGEDRRGLLVGGLGLEVGEAWGAAQGAVEGRGVACGVVVRQVGKG